MVDSSEGAPAFQEVCRFFEQELNLHVPREMREVPVLVVVRMEEWSQESGGRSEDVRPPPPRPPLLLMMSRPLRR